MSRTARLVLASTLVGILAAGCAEQRQTAQVYAPLASTPDAVVSGATTPDFPNHHSSPTRSGLNGDIDNPSGAPGPGNSTTRTY